MDRLPQHNFGLLFMQSLAMGVCTGIYPHCNTLFVLFAVGFVSGAGQGALDASGNSACLEIWRGHEGAPYMHSIHFSFGVGAFLAPIVAAPFLKDTGRDSKIGGFYPIVGGSTILVSLGFLYYGIQEIQVRHRKRKVVQPVLIGQQGEAFVARGTVCYNSENIEKEQVAMQLMFSS